MYCGNNANNPSLTNGTKVLGTRYKCLQKGRNFGYAQPVDPNFLVPYQPIDTTRKYCGNSSVLPEEYDRFGNIYECFLKGVGVGKKLKADNNPINPNPPPQFSFGKSDNDKNNDKNNLLRILTIFLIIFNFGLLYYIKPNLIMETNKKNEKKINWLKFICLYLFMFLISYTILYYTISI